MRILHFTRYLDEQALKRYCSGTLAFRWHKDVMGNGKTQIVSVRVEPRIKAGLQAAADKELRSLANMVEVMVLKYCEENNIPVQGRISEAHVEIKAAKNRE